MKTLELVEALKKERQKGSTALAETVLNIYRTLAKESSNLSEDLPKYAAIIEAARPAMPLVKRFSREVLRRISSPSTDEVLKAVEDVEKTYREMLNSLVEQAVKKLSDIGSVTTMSHSGTVRSILSRLEGLRRVNVLESRPLREGVLMAKVLGEVCEVRVYVDAAAAYALERSDAVVVGADALYSDGSFSAKVGVKPLAASAKLLGKPFHVAADSWKLAEEFVNEEGPSADVDVQLPAENPIFEKVPPVLVDTYLTDLGVLTSSELVECLLQSGN
ncbi:MAG: hypothetical protein QXD24_02655 [Candidatus Caldarchaeum sp.]